MLDTWEITFGIRYNLHQPDWVKLYEWFRHYDPLLVTLFILCNIKDALSILSSIDNAPKLCTVLERQQGDSAPNIKPRLSMPSKRTFAIGYESTGTTLTGQPSVGAILEAVIHDTIPLLYIRQLPYRNRDAGHAAGNGNSIVELNLEVVYDLTDRPDLQQHHGPGLTDHFAVFHIHVERMGVHPHQTVAQPCITVLHVFHGQHVTLTHGQYLVQGRTNQGRPNYNVRTPILEPCPRPGSYWPLGDATVPPQETPELERLRRFGLALRDQGVLTPRTLEGSMQPGTRGDDLWMVSWRPNGREWAWVPSRGDIDGWHGSSPYGPNGSPVTLDLAARFPTLPPTPPPRA